MMKSATRSESAIIPPAAKIDRPETDAPKNDGESDPGTPSVISVAAFGCDSAAVSENSPCKLGLPWIK
ncbi:MAG: hypothetical protein WKF75_14110 [Singulisphaera sp.]